jgi:hypothetical protein
MNININATTSDITVSHTIGYPQQEFIKPLFDLYVPGGSTLQVVLEQIVFSNSLMKDHIINLERKVEELEKSVQSLNNIPVYITV